MRPLDDDRDLREAFRARRQAERHDAPPFARVLAGRPRRRKTALRWVLAAGVVSAGAIVVARAFRPGGAGTDDLELARRLSSWSSPTEFLLRVPGAELLAAPPRLDGAAAGSPLKALDPGGPLGPSIPEGSRRP